MIILPRWLQYIESQIGFVLPVAQHNWLINAIRTTAEAYNLDIESLWRQIHIDADLRQELFDSILILESRFFRHRQSIGYICDLALEQQSKSKQIKSLELAKDADTDQYNDERQDKDKSFSVWSVGCSEGQEVWSIAMSLAQAGIEDYHVLGTDVSKKALRSAKRAVYDARFIKDIPEECHHFIHPHQSNLSAADFKDNDQWSVDKSLYPHVSFAQNNIFLSDSLWQSSAQLLTRKDVIICQNMLIYFRQFDQRDILARLVDRCKLGGHIVLAPGEGFGWQHPQMVRVVDDQVNAWQKVK